MIEECDQLVHIPGLDQHVQDIDPDLSDLVSSFQRRKTTMENPFNISHRLGFLFTIYIQHLDDSLEIKLGPSIMDN
jgi:hypothetical protein